MDLTASASPGPEAPAGNGLVVIAVHGTFAGVASDSRPFWWQDASQLCNEMRESKSDISASFEPFIWKGIDGRPGPNRESERRRWGLCLLKRLNELEGAGQRYHLIGHSHGGSVIWHALRASARSGRQLQNLQSWSTVGTPFLQFGPDRSAWWRIAAALAVIAMLIWWGLPGALAQLAINASTQGLGKAVSGVALLHEFADIDQGLGNTTFYAVLALIAAIALTCLVLLLLPLRDLFRLLAAMAERRQDRLAASWYASRWLGVTHRQDEAVAGLKATLIQPPDLVLRRRRGLLRLLLGVVDPLATAVDQFAWSILMKNAQGADLPAKALRAAGTTPSGFNFGPVELPKTVQEEIVARADSAAAGVLARVRMRLETATDKEDLEALTGVLNGTYDRDSLIHTTMFESAWVRKTLLDHIFSATGPAAGMPVSRVARPWLALPIAKAAIAVGFVVLIGSIMTLSYSNVIYPQTNAAQAEKILARFDEPSFQIVSDGVTPAKALVRAYRLGASLEKVLAAAAKLPDQPEANAYQAIFRELALSGREDQITAWLAPSTTTTQTNARFLQSDHLPLALTAAIEALAASRVQPTMLYSHAATMAAQVMDKGLQNELYRRLIGVAVSLPETLYPPEQLMKPEWLVQLASSDSKCESFKAIVLNAAPRIWLAMQVKRLEAVIRGCRSTGGPEAEDAQRMLRRLAVGMISNCELSAPLLAQASFNRAGADAPIPPRFIDCLVAANRQADAAKLAAAGRIETPHADATLAEARRRWDIAKALQSAGLKDEFAKWAQSALADLEAWQKRIPETDVSLDADALKLEILRAFDPGRYDAFAKELRAGDQEFDNSRQLPAVRNKLRSLHLQQLELAESNQCGSSQNNWNASLAILGILKSYRDQKISHLAMSVLQIADLCKVRLPSNVLSELLAVVSANDDSQERATNISQLAPFAPQLRAAMQLSDSAGLPEPVLAGYVRSVDTLRPSLRPKLDPEFIPIKYVKPG